MEPVDASPRRQPPGVRVVTGKARVESGWDLRLGGRDLAVHLVWYQHGGGVHPPGHDDSGHDDTGHYDVFSRYLRIFLADSGEADHTESLLFITEMVPNESSSWVNVVPQEATVHPRRKSRDKGFQGSP